MKEHTHRAPLKSMPTWETVDDWIREEIQGRFQSILEEEATAFLGRSWYERRAEVDSSRGYRNGYGKPRRLSTSCGTIKIRRPRVRGLEERFESRILPLFARRTRAIGDLLPDLYLHGLSQGDFELSLRALLGDGAPLSPTSIARLRGKWEVDFQDWKERRLDNRELVYAWADGIYVKAGLEREKACLLVVIGAMSDGSKEILAIEPGYRESTESWLTVLRDLRDRGLEHPVLIAADGNMGIWAAVDQVWPESRQQRCWNHKILNVLDKVAKRAQAEARALLVQIPYAGTKKEAEKLRKRFAARYRSQFPAAVETLERNWDRMVTFYDFPKEHWKHLRTTNVVESPFASVRLRTNAARRFKKVRNATALIWRTLKVAESRFRKLTAPHLLQQVYDQKHSTEPQVEAGKMAA